MADNTTLPGTGDVIATDDVGGVKYQRVKPAFGGDGVAIDVSATNPLPVTQNDCVALLNTDLTTWRFLIRLDGNLTHSSHVKYFKGAAS